MDVAGRTIQETDTSAEGQDAFFHATRTPIKSLYRDVPRGPNEL